jgi:hypothetical protein
VIRAGDKFAKQKRKLPGALPGVGYNYDQVWGGLLDDGDRLPPRPVSNRQGAPASMETGNGAADGAERSHAAGGATA